MANEQIAIDIVGNADKLIKSLNQVSRSLDKVVDDVKRLGDSLNTGIIKSSSKATASFNNTATAAKKSANAVVTSLQSEIAAAEKAGRAVDNLNKKLNGIERAKGERQSTYLARIGQAIASTRNLPEKGVTAGGASTAFSPANRDKIIQYQRAVEAEAKAERDRAAQVKKDIAEESALIKERQKLANAMAVSKVFNVPKLAANLNLPFDQLLKDAVGFSNSMAGLRYALYDVTSTAQAMGTALISAVVGPTKAYIEFEKNLASVVRTNVDLHASQATQLKQTNMLRQQLIQLKQEIPVAFGELAQIGTLAGQLDIPINVVGTFTETVAKFAATTDVSASEAATAFGRLGQLIDGVNGRYLDLGSAILAVGTASVATESQIIAVATQIAALGNSVGLTADEVVAFSGTLASMAVTPELSRGLLVRLFTNINAAVASGGRSLREYDRILKQSGVSSESFQKLWTTDSSTALVGFFKGLQAEGSATVKTLNDLGITSVRDVPAIQRLSQNVGLLEKLLNTSNVAFAQGSEVNLQYGVIAETLSGKLQLLTGNFDLLLATLGQGSVALKPIVDILNAITIQATNLADNPITSSFFAVAGTAVAVVGALLLVGAGLTKVTTSFIAASQSSIVLNRELILLGVANVQAAAGFELTEAQSIRAAAGLKGVAAAAGLTGTALKAMLIAGGITAGILLIGAAFELIANSTKSASEQAQGYFKQFGSLEEAIKADTSAWLAGGDALNTVNVKLEDHLDTMRVARDNAEQLAQGYDTARESLVKLGDATQTIAFGQAYAEWVKNEFIANEEIQKLASDPAVRDTLYSLGFDLGELIKAGSKGSAQDYIKSLTSQMAQGSASAPQALYANARGVNTGQTLAFDALQTGGELEAYAKQLDNAYIATLDTASAQQYLDTSLLDVGLETENTSKTIQDYVDAVYEVPNKLKAVEDALFALGQQFTEGGKGAIESSSEMQSAIIAIGEASGTSTQTVANLTAFLAFLEEKGYASATAIQYLKSAIEQFGGDAGTAVANIDFSSFVSGMNDAGAATAAAAKEVRTLVDYANDLQSVFSRAFDLRFKKQLAVDDITSQWADLADEINRAKEEIDGLTADRAQLEYFLSIAEAYGDTLRANQLRAEIAKIDKDIADATASASTELQGNSQEAINNRKRLTSLVSSYQDYIVSLAESGASQAKINKAIRNSRNEFIDQATALGYSESEIRKYVKSFDDMKTIVAKVPRNLTIGVNANPALQALAEFNARANEATRPRTLVIDTKIKGDKDGATVLTLQSQYAGKLALYNKMMDSKNYTAAARLAEDLAALARQIRALGGIIATGKPGGMGTFATGGYTGNGGKYQEAGIVHKGEYVMNADVVKRYGVGFFDNLTQMKNPSYAVSKVAAPNSMMVSLSPEDRALLRGSGGSGDIILTVDSREIARANAKGSKLVTSEGGYLNG